MASEVYMSITCPLNKQDLINYSKVSVIRQLVSIEDSQFGFVPDRGTTGAIFVVRQLQEKYLAANKRLYMAFVDLEKAFGWGPWKVIWWALRKTWCGGMDCVSGAGDICQYAEPCPCWWAVQWRVWNEGRCSPRLSIQPAALHHCAWSFAMGVSFWGPLGGPLCWWPCYNRWIAGRMCQEALDLERSNGGERYESKCRKDKDHDLWHGLGPPGEQVSFHALTLALEWAPPSALIRHELNHVCPWIIILLISTYREYTRQAHDVNTTLPQRPCNVMTLHRRWGDVVFTSCARWVESSCCSVQLLKLCFL